VSLIVWVLEENPSQALYERLGGRIVGEKAWGGNDEYGIEVKEVAYGWLNIEELSIPRDLDGGAAA
jgi:hypothetical protein